MKYLSKLRVYELAKELNTSSSRLLKKLADIGVQKNNHMSYIEDDELKKLYSDLGIHKNETKSTEIDKSDDNIVAKKTDVKTIVKVTEVQDQRQSKNEQPVHRDVRKPKEADENTGKQHSGNRQFAGRQQSRNNKYSDKKRDIATSGLLGDMKVITEDDRMKMLREKARKLKMEQERIAEQEKKDQIEQKTTKDPIVTKIEKVEKKIEKVEQKIEKEVPVVKVEKISQDPKKERDIKIIKQENNLVQADTSKPDIKQETVNKDIPQKPETVSAVSVDERAVNDPDTNIVLKDKAVEKSVTEPTQEQNVAFEPKQDETKIKDELKTELKTELKNMNDEQKKSHAVKDQNREQTVMRDYGRSQSTNRQTGKTYSGDREQNKEYSSNREQKRIQYPAKDYNQGQTGNKDSERYNSREGFKDRDDNKGYQKKPGEYVKKTYDNRKDYDNKKDQTGDKGRSGGYVDYKTGDNRAKQDFAGKNFNDRGRFNKDAGKSKKDLDIPKAETTGKEENKAKNTGDRRNYLVKDNEKLDKREQKKGAEKPVVSPVKTGYQVKKTKYKQPDFMVGQKKGVDEILSEDFILEEFYGKEAEFDKRAKKSRSKQKMSPPTPPREVLKHVVLPDSMTVKTFSERIKKTSGEVIIKLMELGIIANVNQSLDFETASLISEEFGITAKKEVVVTEEDILFDDSADDDDNLEPRPPIVVVMGHVDHGKTSLLDAIKNTNVIAGEAGGITQHIGAYMVNINGRDITFLDTPGHEAFTSMRARGAQVTDIAILVVAADDGVMPQTVEAINHAKAAGVAIIVAINKIDSPNANPEKVKQELTEYGLVAEEWGGDTICVNVSALKNDNIDSLLEMVLLTADVLELKTNPAKQAKGTVIESRLDKNTGAIATLLVQRGTLKSGDSIVTGSTVGRIRRMTNDKGQEIISAGPSTPVEIMGLHEVPVAGDEFYAIEDEKLARQLAEKRREVIREKSIGGTNNAVTLEDLFSQIQQGNMKELNIIIKADVHGSVEAVKQSLEKLSNDEVKIKIIHGAVGTINESDVQLAAVSNAIIIGFNVRPGINVTEAAENAKVDIRLYRIIYNAIEDIQAAMKGMLDPTFKENVLGHVEIRQIFKVSGIGTIAGCYVTDGKIARSDSVRLLRNGIVIYEGKPASLKRFKEDAREVTHGYECGLSLENYNDIKEGDIVEVYEMVAVEK